MIHGSNGLLVFLTWTLLRGVQGAMSTVPDQPPEQHSPRLADSTIQDQKNHLLRRSMSIILEQPSEEYASEFESLGPRISKEQGDAGIEGTYDIYYIPFSNRTRYRGYLPLLLIVYADLE